MSAPFQLAINIALVQMSERGRRLLRFNPVVETASEAVAEAEVYQAFAY